MRMPTPTPVYYDAVLDAMAEAFERICGAASFLEAPQVRASGVTAPYEVLAIASCTGRLGGQIGLGMSLRTAGELVERGLDGEMRAGGAVLPEVAAIADALLAQCREALDAHGFPVALSPPLVQAGDQESVTWSQLYLMEVRFVLAVGPIDLLIALAEPHVCPAADLGAQMGDWIERRVPEAC